MSCHTAVIKRLFRRTQYIIVTATAPAAITEQPAGVKQNISFACQANYAYGLCM